jgi:hypothetical protein
VGNFACLWVKNESTGFELFGELVEHDFSNATESVIDLRVVWVSIFSRQLHLAIRRYNNNDMESIGFFHYEAEWSWWRVTR